jgi:hypothetical protein
MKCELPLESRSFTPSYVQTPVLSEKDSFFLIACISARSKQNHRLLSKGALSNYKIYPFEGSPRKEFLSCDSLDHLVIALPHSEAGMASCSLSVVSACDEESVLIQLPLHVGGCRYSYFVIESLNLSLCLVHELVSVESGTDLFIEEQEFLFSCMEIQHELFLRENAPQPIPSPPIDDHIPESPQNGDRDQIKLSTELRVMNSLIAKYEQTRVSSSTTGYNSNSTLSL